MKRSKITYSIIVLCAIGLFACAGTKTSLNTTSKPALPQATENPRYESLSEVVKRLNTKKTKSKTVLIKTVSDSVVIGTYTHTVDKIDLITLRTGNSEQSIPLSDVKELWLRKRGELVTRWIQNRILLEKKSSHRQ